MEMTGSWLKRSNWLLNTPLQNYDTLDLKKREQYLILPPPPPPPPPPGGMVCPGPPPPPHSCTPGRDRGPTQRPVGHLVLLLLCQTETPPHGLAFQCFAQESRLSRVNLLTLPRLTLKWSSLCTLRHFFYSQDQLFRQSHLYHGSVLDVLDTIVQHYPFCPKSGSREWQVQETKIPCTPTLTKNCRSRDILANSMAAVYHTCIV